MMKAFNKSFDDIKKMLDTFAEATHQNSAMTYSEFCKYLDLEEGKLCTILVVIVVKNYFYSFIPLLMSSL